MTGKELGARKKRREDGEVIDVEAEVVSSSSSNSSGQSGSSNSGRGQKFRARKAREASSKAASMASQVSGQVARLGTYHEWFKAQ